MAMSMLVDDLPPYETPRGDKWVIVPDGGFRDIDVSTPAGVQECVDRIVTAPSGDASRPADHAYVYSFYCDIANSKSEFSMYSDLVVCVNAVTGYAAVVYDHTVASTAERESEEFPWVWWDPDASKWLHPRHVVPIEDAVAALRFYLETVGELPGNIHWSTFHPSPQHPNSSVGYLPKGVSL